VLLYRVPRGVVSVISPWNWPYTMPGEILAPALAYGNAVVWAPAPTTSICAVKLAECVADADLPAGVFNMITGPGSVVGDEVGARVAAQLLLGTPGPGLRLVRIPHETVALPVGAEGDVPVVVVKEVATAFARGPVARGLRRPPGDASDSIAGLDEPGAIVLVPGCVPPREAVAAGRLRGGRRRALGR